MAAWRWRGVAVAWNDMAMASPWQYDMTMAWLLRGVGVAKT
jgi:hypothetical protein